MAEQLTDELIEAIQLLIDSHDRDERVTAERHAKALLEEILASV